MLIYKSKYKVYRQPDSNKDDTFLQSKYGQIYRYSKDVLKVWLFVSSGKLTVPRKIAEKIKRTVQVLDCFEDDESVELDINESDLDKIIDIMKIRRRKPMDKSSEQYKTLMERLS